LSFHQVEVDNEPDQYKNIQLDDLRILTEGEQGQTDQGNDDVYDQGILQGQAADQLEQGLGQKEISQGKGSQYQKADKTVNGEAEKIGDAKRNGRIGNQALHNIGKDKSGDHQGQKNEGGPEPVQPMTRR